MPTLLQIIRKFRFRTSLNVYHSQLSKCITVFASFSSRTVTIESMHPRILNYMTKMFGVLLLVDILVVSLEFRTFLDSQEGWQEYVFDEVMSTVYVIQAVSPTSFAWNLNFNKSFLPVFVTFMSLSF